MHPRAATMPRTLVVADKFPPVFGGIQTFTWSLVRHLPADRVVVLAPEGRDTGAFDAQSGVPVLRVPRLRIGREGARHVQRTVAEYGCKSVWFSSAGPLGLLAPAARAGGADTIVASTHGHELNWSRLPGGQEFLRRLAERVDVLTHLTPASGASLRRIVGERHRLHRLSGGVDVVRFATADGGEVRRALDLANAPVVVCVSRLVPRKGQDTLIRAMVRVRRVVPDTRLLIVGEGPSRSRLMRLARAHLPPSSVIFAGAVTNDKLPRYLAAGDVFALACRTRWGGLDVEGLGICSLEAAAAGLPVIVGASGGAPDAVLDGHTGLVCNGADPAAVADALIPLLTNPDRARAMGRAGRTWAERHWSWAALAADLSRYLGQESAVGPETVPSEVAATER